MDILNVVTNVNPDGWGPNEQDEETVSSCLDSINKFPFEPKLKLDKQMHICDFTFGTYQRNVREGNRITKLNSTSLEEELQFQTVDSRTVAKAKPGVHRRKVVVKQTTQAFNQKVAEEEQLEFSKKKLYPEIRRQKYLLKARALRLPMKYQTLNEWSIEPTPSWTVVAEISFNLLLKQDMDSSVVEVEDVAWRGKLGLFDKKFDQIGPKNEVILLPLSNSYDYYFTSTTDDDCIAEACLDIYKSSPKPSFEGEDSEKEKEDKEEHFEPDKRMSNMPLQADSESYDLAMKVEKELLKYDKIVLAATDQILAVLMTAARSKYSWHLKVTKIENQITLDKQNGSIIDMLTVNETSPDPPLPDCEMKVNRPSSLRFEAVKINQNLRQQVLLQDQFAETYDDPPFVDPTDNPATIAYRYRKFTIPGSANATNFEKLPILVVTRCEVHSKLPGTDTLAYVCALNECPNKNSKSWKSQIETQKGALLANEIRNNTTKLQRFVACAFLGGCNVFKLGYVVRKVPTEAENHSVIGIQTHTTDNLALQMGFSIDNAWASIKAIVQLIIRKPDGKYVLLKDPMKPIVRLYSVTEEEDLDQIVIPEPK